MNGLSDQVQGVYRQATGRKLATNKITILYKGKRISACSSHHAWQLHIHVGIKGGMR